MAVSSQGLICVLSLLPTEVGQIIYVLTVHYDGTEEEFMPKARKGFRFNPQVYASFKELASKNGYTVTAALEKFMGSAVEYGLVFPSVSKTEVIDAEARIMLSWLKNGRYWVNLGGGEETSTRGRLLQLLPNVESAELRLEIEETLKKIL